MSNTVNINQTVGFSVKKMPVICSHCGESRTQYSRCENCGCEIPYEEEKRNEKQASS